MMTFVHKDVENREIDMFKAIVYGGILVVMVLWPALIAYVLEKH